MHPLFPLFDRYFKIITVYSTNSRLHPLLINSERSHIPIIVILFIVLKLCSMITLLSGYEQSVAPSTTIVCPVMYLASFEARKAMAAATSSGSPK